MTENDALALVRAAEVRTAINDATAGLLRDVLRFLPPGGGRQLLWPDLWLRAGRVLARAGRFDLLRDVAEGPLPHYLGTVGALALAERGELTAVVRDWLKSTRDYSLLTADERARLDPILARIGADAERAALAAAG